MQPEPSIPMQAVWGEQKHRLSKKEKLRKNHRRRARRAAKSRVRHKIYLKNKNRKLNGLPKRKRASHLRREKESKGFVRIVAPDVMSFIQNPEGVSTFAARLKQCFLNREPVWIDLRTVTHIDFDAISVLLAAVVRFKAHKIKFNGDMPNDRTALNTLLDSHFFDHLTKRQFKDEDSYHLTISSSILTHAKKRVDSKLGENIINATSRHVWREERRCPGLQRVMVELMQNTNNHASLDEEGTKHWWLSVRHETDDAVSRFSFVDYGVGIFVNLENKRQSSKFFGALGKLRDRISLGKNCDILEMILKGELHRTASGKYYRGKGLPGIFQALEKGEISNLCIITNDAYFYSKTNTYKTISNPFNGTFVSWEINKNSHSLV